MELLVGRAKGLANFETVRKLVEENVYLNWTVLHFILVLLNLKVKHSWSDGSFNNLLLILAWLLPKANKVPANTCQAKKLGSPFTIGVERTIHACPNNYILYRGIFSMTFTNAMYVLQVSTKTMLVTVVATIMVRPM